MLQIKKVESDSNSEHKYVGTICWMVVEFLIIMGITMLISDSYSNYDYAGVYLMGLFLYLTIRSSRIYMSYALVAQSEQTMILLNEIKPQKEEDMNSAIEELMVAKKRGKILHSGIIISQIIVFFVFFSNL